MKNFLRASRDTVKDKTTEATHFVKEKAEKTVKPKETRAYKSLDKVMREAGEFTLIEPNNGYVQKVRELLSKEITQFLAKLIVPIANKPNLERNLQTTFTDPKNRAALAELLYKPYAATGAMEEAVSRGKMSDVVRFSFQRDAGFGSQAESALEDFIAKFVPESQAANKAGEFGAIDQYTWNHPKNITKYGNFKVLPKTLQASISGYAGEIVEAFWEEGRMHIANVHGALSGVNIWRDLATAAGDSGAVAQTQDLLSALKAHYPLAIVNPAKQPEVVAIFRDALKASNDVANPERKTAAECIEEVLSDQNNRDILAKHQHDNVALYMLHEYEARQALKSADVGIVDTLENVVKAANQSEVPLPFKFTETYMLAVVAAGGDEDEANKKLSEAYLAYAHTPFSRRLLSENAFPELILKAIEKQLCNPEGMLVRARQALGNQKTHPSKDFSFVGTVAGASMFANLHTLGKIVNKTEVSDAEQNRLLLNLKNQFMAEIPGGESVKLAGISERLITQIMSFKKSPRDSAFYAFAIETVEDSKKLVSALKEMATNEERVFDQAYLESLDLSQKLGGQDPVFSAVIEELAFKNTYSYVVMGSMLNPDSTKKVEAGAPKQALKFNPDVMHLALTLIDPRYVNQAHENFLSEVQAKGKDAFLNDPVVVSPAQRRRASNDTIVVENAAELLSGSGEGKSPSKSPSTSSGSGTSPSPAASSGGTSEEVVPQPISIVLPETEEVSPSIPVPPVTNASIPLRLPTSPSMMDINQKKDMVSNLFSPGRGPRDPKLGFNRERAQTQDDQDPKDRRPPRTQSMQIEAPKRAGVWMQAADVAKKRNAGEEGFIPDAINEGDPVTSRRVAALAKQVSEDEAKASELAASQAQEGAGSGSSSGSGSTSKSQSKSSSSSSKETAEVNPELAKTATIIASDAPAKEVAASSTPKPKEEALKSPTKKALSAVKDGAGSAASSTKRWGVKIFNKMTPKKKPVFETAQDSTEDRMLESGQKTPTANDNESANKSSNFWQDRTRKGQPEKDAALSPSSEGTSRSS